MRILETMKDPISSKSSIDQVSPGLTLEEIGTPDSELGLIDTSRTATLGEWTARDFSNIYVKYRPHLEAQARRFLRDATQAEEVVQDAFLYLMTALPELDSELGVLKFLKWKVRLLALDAVRASSRNKQVSLEESPELRDDELEPLEIIERADEAAIVSLALAKLDPRQRHALIATVYQDLTYREAATALGVSENAFRQLLFRARKSFKVALIGSAEVEGRTISEILSIAARHSLASARIVPVLLIFSLLSLGSSALVWPGGEAAIKQVATLDALDGSSTNDLGVQLRFQSQSVEEPEPAMPPNLSVGEGSDTNTPDSVEINSVNVSPITLAIETEPIGNSNLTGDRSFSQSRLEAAVFEWASALLTDLTGSSQAHELERAPHSLTLSIGQTTRIALLLSPHGDGRIESAILSGTGEKDGLVAIPTAVHRDVRITPDGKKEVTSILTGFAVGDLSGTLGSEVLENAHFRDIAIQVVLLYSSDATEALESVTTQFIPRS